LWGSFRFLTIKYDATRRNFVDILYQLEEVSLCSRTNFSSPHNGYYELSVIVCVSQMMILRHREFRPLKKSNSWLTEEASVQFVKCMILPFRIAWRRKDIQDGETAGIVWEAPW